MPLLNKIDTEISVCKVCHETDKNGLPVKHYYTVGQDELKPWFDYFDKTPNAAQSIFNIYKPMSFIIWFFKTDFKLLYMASTLFEKRTNKFVTFGILKIKRKRV